MFREPNGKISFARIGCALVLVATLAWGTIIVIHSYTMPDLMGVTSLLTALYGANRIGAAISNRNQ